jgi:hypothetical protein
MRYLGYLPGEGKKLQTVGQIFRCWALISGYLYGSGGADLLKRA